jgi:hypothetical protein
MALANEILAVRFNQGLFKLLGMKEGAPAPQLSTDVQAVLDITGPRTELERLLGCQPWITYTSYGPHAGEYSILGVRSPPAPSKLITVVEGVMFRPTGVQVIELRLENPNPPPPAFSGISQAQKADTVGTGGPLAATQQVVYHGGVARGVQVMEVYLAYSLVFDKPIILAPGWALLIKSPNVNTAVVGSMWGYERLLEESEER